MKKIVVSILIILTCFSQVMLSQSVWDGTATAFSVGDGSQTNPYLIQSASEFAYLAQQVNAGNTYSQAYFSLTTDIDLNNISWNPIGKSSTIWFKGYFDGNNHKISNLKINNPASENQGLFGYFGYNATLSNLHVTSGNVTGLNYVGALMGFMSPGATITNCTNKASVSGTRYVGGVVGYAQYHLQNGTSVIDKTTISKCVNYANIIGTESVGGIAGYSCNINECCNLGVIKGVTIVGGIIGNTDHSTVSRLSNFGVVIGKNSVAGIGSGASSSSVSSIFNSGTVMGESVVSGLFCGFSASTVSNCFNSGRVSGIQSTGGICVSVGTDNTFTNCFYDKQLVDKALYCSDVSSNGIVGKLTSEMLGDALKTSLGETDWLFDANLYTRFKNGFENTDIALLGATPVFFSSVSNTFFDKGNTVLNNFTASIDGTVTWSSTSGKVTISGNNITLNALGNDTLVASLNGIQKLIPIDMISTSVKPLTIDNAADLIAFRDAVNNNGSYKGVSSNDGLRNMYFLVTQDIDLNAVCGKNIAGKEVSWIPIGHIKSGEDILTHDGNNFKGCFDGGSHFISNLYINTTESNQGLFGYINYGSIKNIHIKSGQITGNENLGGLVGYIFGETILSNCSNHISIKGNADVGGIAGAMNWDVSTKIDPIISNCVNSGWIEGLTDVSTSIGGIVGNLNYTQLSNCMNVGLVKGLQSIGGIGGYASTSTIGSCVNTGELRETRTGYTGIGGIVGQSTSNTFTNCFYDKQMSGVNGAVIKADISGASGKKTTEMLGTLLQTTLGTTNWIFTSGLYPILKTGIETSDLALLTSIPIYLSYTDATNYETPNFIGSDFTLSTVNNVGWIARNNRVSIVADKAGYLAVGQDTLVASLNGSQRLLSIRLISSPKYPLTIDNLADLVAFRDAVNNNGRYKSIASDGGFKKMYFLMTTDIDLSSVCGKSINGIEQSWTPIGNLTNLFRGIFDGGNHRIENLYIHSVDKDYMGCFGYIEYAGITNMQVTGEVNAVNNSYVGAVAGRMDYDSYIKNCINYASINAKSTVGGIAGYAFLNPTIENCINYGKIAGTTCGGIVGGMMNARISNCKNYAAIGKEDGSNTYVGGVIGSGYRIRNYPQYPYTYIENCNNMAPVLGGNNVGGIVGAISEDVFISNCINSATIKGTDYTGGILGNTSVYDYTTPNISLIQSTNTGNVSGADYVGGIAGRFVGITFTTCFNSGNIQGNNYLGGISGIPTVLSYSINVGQISASTGGTYIGAIAGQSYTINNCFYDKQMCPVGGANGADIANKAVGKLTSEIIGSQLALGASWEYATDLYPRVKVTKDSLASIVAATPIFLQNNETVANVVANFTLGTNNQVLWTNANPLITSLSGGNASLLKSGKDTLYASLNGVVYKSIPYVSNPNITNIFNSTTDKNGMIYSVGKTIVVKGDGGNRIEIYTISGEKILSKNTINTEEVFPVSVGGVYLVRIGQTVQKIIVK